MATMKAVALVLLLAVPCGAMEVAIGASRTSATQNTFGGDWPLTCPSCLVPTALPAVVGGKWFERVGWNDAHVNLGIGGMISAPIFLPGGPWQVNRAKQLGATRIWSMGFVLNDCVVGATPATIVSQHLALRAQAAPIPLVFIQEAHASVDPTCPPPYADVAAVNACIDQVNAVLATHPPYVSHSAGTLNADWRYAVCQPLPDACPNGDADYCDGVHGGETFHAEIAAAVKAFAGVP